MEATAVLSALRSFRGASELTIATDSLHLVRKIDRVRSGASLGRCAASWRPLLRQIAQELARAGGEGRRVELVWVRGHSGDVGNTHADRLAGRAARRAERRALQRPATRAS
jgi:ribonuclease HI